MVARFATGRGKTQKIRLIMVQRQLFLIRVITPKSTYKKPYGSQYEWGKTLFNIVYVTLDSLKHSQVPKHVHADKMLILDLNLRWANRWKKYRVPCFQLRIHREAA